MVPAHYAAVYPNAENGAYYGPGHDKKGYPVEVRASKAALDEDEARRLWQLSEKLTSVTYAI